MAQEYLEGFLPYTPVDLERLLWFAETHGVEAGGRYDLAVADGLHEAAVASRLFINVWTHPWSTAATKAESTAMCGFEFDRPRSSLIRVWPCPDFDWDAVRDELTQLEMPALGATVHGRFLTR